MKFLLIDNYDSFTYMLADYVKQCGLECDVIRNDNEKLLESGFVSGYDAIVLSPGPGNPQQAGQMMKIIESYHTSKPVLGICLGHQAIGEFFGATLVKAALPRHGKVDEVIHTAHPLFSQVPEKLMVTRYHSLILTDVKPPLQVIASTPNNEVMALAHNHLPVFGIQFHPESCLTEHGLTLIKNYTEIVKQGLNVS